MRYKIKDNILWKIVDNEAVIVVPDKDEYFYLNPTGTEIWKLINKGFTKEKILQNLYKKYKAAKKKISEDVEKLLKKLMKMEIIEEISKK